MSKFVIVNGATSLNSEEIVAIIPQRDEEADKYNVIAILKNGVQIMIRANCSSINEAFIHIDNFTGMIDQTYRVQFPYSALQRLAEQEQQENEFTTTTSHNEDDAE